MIAISDRSINEPMLDLFIFETVKQIEQLEQLIISNEKSSCYTQNAINEIFRIMHTIKGSSAMMLFDNISTLSHTIEDLFYFIREEKPREMDCSTLSDLVLEGVDFIKVEVEKIKNGHKADGDAEELARNIKAFLSTLKEGGAPAAASASRSEDGSLKRQYYISQDKTAVSAGKNMFKAVLHFEEGCEMENVRAYSVVHSLGNVVKELHYIPEDIMANEESVRIIREEGFTVYIKTDLSYDDINEMLLKTVFLKELDITRMENSEAENKLPSEKKDCAVRL